MSQQNDTLAFLLGVIIGAVVGALVAALVIPQKALETRDQVAVRGLELKSRTADVVQRAQQTASNTIARIQATARELVSSATPGRTEG